jgi:HNH endonuclease
MGKKKLTSQQRWAKKNRSKLAAACRRWRARHPEKQKAATYRRRRNNLAKWNAYQRRWRKRNIHLVRAATRRRWRKLKQDPIRYEGHLAASRKWATEHPEVLRRKARRYRRKNLSKVRAYHRRWMNRWYRSHLLEARRRSRLSRKKNLEKWRRYDRRLYRTKLKTDPKWVAKKRARGQLWVKRNPLKQRHRVAVYRARKIGAKGSHTLDQWMSVVRLHSWKCFYCGKKLNRKTLTKDHRNPLSKGGTDFVRNLVPACKACNSGKAGRRHYRKRRE